MFINAERGIKACQYVRGNLLMGSGNAWLKTEENAIHYII